MNHSSLLVVVAAGGVSVAVDVGVVVVVDGVVVVVDVGEFVAVDNVSVAVHVGVSMLLHVGVD